MRGPHFSLSGAVVGLFLALISLNAAASSCCGCVAAAHQVTQTVLIQQITASEQTLSQQISQFQRSLEDLLIKISNTLQGEIAKQTQALRAVQESIATYQLQEGLRRDAVELSEKLEQPKYACQTMAMSEGIHVAANTSRSRAAVFTRTRVEALLNEASPRAHVLNAYKRSTTKYCSEFDKGTGRCSGTPELVSGDTTAAYLFGSANGTGLTYDSKQSEAVDAYIDRVIGTPPASLPYKCETEQCKAFEEMRKDYVAHMSLSAHSLAEIASAYTPQTGLADRTGVKGVTGKSDISMMEAIESFVKMKFSKDAIQANGAAPSTQTVLRDLAQNQAFRLWLDFQNLRQMERIEAMQAAELALVGGSYLRASVEAQRTEALKSARR